MKSKDWNGHKIPLVAHAYNLAKGIGALIHIRAGTEEEALQKVAEKLKHNERFLRVTEGHYTVDFSRDV